MNKSLPAIGAGGWAKTGRRSATILITLLAINFVLVIVAVGGFGERAEVAPTRASTTPYSTASVSESLEDSAAEAVAALSTSKLDPLPNAVVGPAAPLAEPTVGVNNDRHGSGEPVQPAAVPAQASIATEDTKTTGSTDATGHDDPPAKAIPGTADSRVAYSATNSRQPALIIINAPTTGGVVHYVVDNAVFSLLPGEFQRLEGTQQRRIAFHRGDDFDIAERVVSEGVFVFGLSNTGWELGQPSTEVAARLLSTCRPLSASKQ